MSQLYPSAAWVNGVVMSFRVDLLVGGFEKGHLPFSHEDWGVRLHMGKVARSALSGGTITASGHYLGGSA